MKTVDEAKKVLEDGMPEAAETLNDEEKSKSFIEKLEEKLKNTKLNGVLEAVPLLISCVKSYIKHEYTEIPVGTMVAIVSALVYWINPFDIIPDTIPGVGHIDDAAVVLVCLSMVKTDLDGYKAWLEKREAE